MTDTMPTPSDLPPDAELGYYADPAAACPVCATTHRRHETDCWIRPDFGPRYRDGYTPDGLGGTSHERPPEHRPARA